MCSTRQKNCVASQHGSEITKNYHSTQTEKSFPNAIKSNRNQSVFIIIRLIWNRTDVRLAPNQSENGEYNLISVDLKGIGSIDSYDLFGTKRNSIWF